VLERAVQLLLVIAVTYLGLKTLGHLPTELDLGDHRGRKILQQRNVPLRPQPWRAVDDTETAQHVALA
jgi:hypothetical protein